MRLLLIALGLVISLLSVAQDANNAHPGFADDAHSQLSAALAARLQATNTAPLATVNPIAQAVAGFYARRDYAPAWYEPLRLQELISALDSLINDGLEPEDYSITFLRQMHQQLAAGQYPLPGEQVEWELLATNAYLRALYHLFNGKVNPVGLDPQWAFALHDIGPAAAVELIADEATLRSIAAVFAQTRPQHPAYASLQAGLARYRQLAAAGGWPSLPTGPTLKPCAVDPQVALLRARLQVTGEYQPMSGPVQAQALAACLPEQQIDTLDDATPALQVVPEPDASSSSEVSSVASTAPDDITVINPAEVYDEYLVAAVKQFQRDQYLEDDGVIGPATRAALNVSAQGRVDQIRVNLDRARWLLHHIPQDLVLVDIAGFKVTYFKAGQPIWTSRVQVGTSYRTTPVFNSAINYITLNPTWTVPPTILRKDLLPKVRKDINYLRENNIRVLDSSGNELDPATIDWNRPGNVTLRQDAGNDAALGKAVIRFPNPHAVYLHDTPHQKLFNKSQRAFSSGCIRIERALELVELLLRETPGWDGGAISKALATGKTRHVTLAQRVPIMLAYWTVDAVSETKIAFKPDIYARDSAVLAALNQRVNQPLLSVQMESGDAVE